MHIWMSSILYIILFGCSERKRITIHIFETNEGYYEWYYYSNITDFSSDHIDFVDANCNRISIFEGEGIFNVRLNGNQIFFDCFSCDTLYFNTKYSERVKIFQSNDTIAYYSVDINNRTFLEQNTKLNKFGCKQFPPTQPGGRIGFIKN